MGDLVELQCEPSVEYDGQALCVIARMADALLDTAKVMRVADSEKAVQRGLQIIDDMRPYADVLSEHIDTIERHVEEILDALMDDEEGYFSNESGLKALTVTSIIRKRRRSIRIQRFLVKKTDGNMAPDNDILALEYRNGALACGLSEAADVPERIKKRVRTYRS